MAQSLTSLFKNQKLIIATPHCLFLLCSLWIAREPLLQSILSEGLCGKSGELARIFLKNPEFIGYKEQVFSLEENLRQEKAVGTKR